MKPVTDLPSTRGVKQSGTYAVGWKEVIALLICIAIPWCITYGFRQADPGGIQMIDFGELYFGARCALHSLDPYNPDAVFHEFKAEGGRFVPGTEKVDRTVVTGVVNLPSGLMFAVPFALLPWGLAQNVWTIFMAVLLLAAASLTWDLGGRAAPLLWLILTGFMLAESDLLFKTGNIAGIAVSLCVIAVWCFLRQRFLWIGVLLLAVSLVLKPHDAGFVWLYFLVARGPLRRRALQTLAVVAILAACSAIWIRSVSPHWIQEAQSNLAIASARGGSSDPGPAGMTMHTAGMIIDLQSVFSGFKDDPHFYNALAFLVAGLPILALLLAAFRKRPSLQASRLALAALSALSLVFVYHRINDSAILLLAIPACAVLWSGKKSGRVPALALTAAGILFTASFFLNFVAENFKAIVAFTSELPGRLPTVFAFHPTPFFLLAMGLVYLGIYVRCSPEEAEKPSEIAAPALSEAI